MLRTFPGYQALLTIVLSIIPLLSFLLLYLPYHQQLYSSQDKHNGLEVSKWSSSRLTYTCTFWNQTKRFNNFKWIQKWPLSDSFQPQEVMLLFNKIFLEDLKLILSKGLFPFIFLHSLMIEKRNYFEILQIICISLNQAKRFKKLNWIHKWPFSHSFQPQEILSYVIV